jgi:hypothetical protein
VLAAYDEDEELWLSAADDVGAVVEGRQRRPCVTLLYVDVCGAAECLGDGGRGPLASGLMKPGREARVHHRWYSGPFRHRRFVRELPRKSQR